MIDLYYWPTGNGKKITIMLEECGLPYQIRPVNIGKGEQHDPAFVEVSPNGKLPAIVDTDCDGGPISLFESGAILVYLAEKTGKFLSTEIHARMNVLKWLFWQVGGLGPMAGQAHYFLHYAATRNEEGMARFGREVARLYGVMERKLGETAYLAGDEYTIADMAAWPWVFRHDWQGQDLKDFPGVERWFKNIGKRPAVVRGSNVGAELADLNNKMDDADRDRLFNLDR